MCGIVGIIGPSIPDIKERIVRMNDSIAYRGPDDEGYHIENEASFGIRRLSIIDLKSGSQPIYNEDRNLLIVYNGEVYNYRELRDDLQKKGHSFNTQSDTEVILHQYEEDEHLSLEKLNGMFAISIWDIKEKKLFLARDRLGIKPLYYYYDRTNFIFASEIKSILESGLVDKKINMEAVWNYLTFRYIPGPETIWKGIMKLPPGHYLTWKKGSNLEISRYWDIPLTDDFVLKPFDEYLEEFTDLFIDSVKLRLISDVPVGVLLSGGLDSSSVASAIAETSVTRLSSFSVAFEGDEKNNELPYSRVLSKSLGLDHYEVIIGKKEVLDFLPSFTYLTDEPLADLASIPLYYVARLAREKVKVVLSGEGSDEVLAGYSFDTIARRWHLLEKIQHLPQRMLDIIPNIAGLMPRGLGERLEKISVPLKDYNIKFLPHITNFFDTNQKIAIMRPSIDFADSRIILHKQYERAKSSLLLHQMLYVYCQSWLVEDLLMKADRMTMGNSLELRVPFLDYRLVEWAFRTPPYIKVKGPPLGRDFLSKYILRSFAKRRVPQQIIDRPKMGFPVPLYDWLSNSLKDWAHDTLDSKETKCTDFFDKNAVKEILIKGTIKDSDDQIKHKLWIILIFELWVRNWVST